MPRLNAHCLPIVTVECQGSMLAVNLQSQWNVKAQCSLFTYSHNGMLRPNAHCLPIVTVEWQDSMLAVNL